MLRIVLLIISIITIIKVNAQVCSSSNITLLSQADVDNFQTNFGPCDTVILTLQIGDYSNTTSNITDLTPLSGIKNVGSLLIVDNDQLVSLNGLQNIVKNGVSKLIVTKNLLLNDISQLSGFGPSGGDIGITENPALPNLIGLQGLRTLGTSLSIAHNPLITDLNPLSGISRIDKALVVENNDALTDITGLSNLVIFGNNTNSSFILKDNDNLDDCSSLCFVIQRILPLLNNLTKEIQNNLGECIDETTIISSCINGNNGIYSGGDIVPTGTRVALKDTILFDTSTLVIDGIGNKVGIGTNAPSASLEVAGTMRLSSLPSSGTLDKIAGLNGDGDLFQYDISNYDSNASDDVQIVDIRNEISDSIAAIVYTVDTKLTETEVEAFIDGDETTFSNWDKNTSDDVLITDIRDEISDSIAAIIHTVDTKLTDADIANLGYIKSPNDGDTSSTNELYDDNELRVSIADHRAALTILEARDVNTSFYTADGAITDNRAITLGINDINFDTNTLVIDGSENKVGIGTSTPTYELDVIGDVGISGAIYGLSDARLKKNEKPIQNALTLLSKLNPVTYKFRTQEYEHLNLQSEKQYGLIAQEVEKIMPELVSAMTTSQGEELKSINYNALISVLIAAIQEQGEEILKLKKKTKF